MTSNIKFDKRLSKFNKNNNETFIINAIIRNFFILNVKNFLDNYSQFCNMRKWVCLQGTGYDNL